MPTPQQDLSVRNESVQRLYSLYIHDRFLVNRRYQRKLVWTVEEKEQLIDSIARDLPLPLILVAESTRDVGSPMELIDGLQRMNAIFSFIENEFSLSGKYFDLDTLADTKLRKDQGELRQSLPLLSREESNQIANYVLALSVFRSSENAAIEEVFRRINSGGRRLSRQALRQAGTVSPLADLVRVASSRVRGDTSPTDLVPLRRMPTLSITNYDLSYGVNVDEIYWVSEGILRREDVRDSADEQLVLDLLADMLCNPLPYTGQRLRDAYYDYVPTEDSSQPSAESLSINNAIDVRGSETVADDFMATQECIREIVSVSQKRFSALIGVGSGGRCPRYYHAVFMATYDLLYRDGMRLSDSSRAAEALAGSAHRGINIPSGGGDWNVDAKRSAIDATKGLLRASFEPRPDGEDLARFSHASQLETILGNALIEQQLFDAKQGLVRLGGERVFDQSCLIRIAETLTGMANMGPGAKGYVVLGVADNQQAAENIEEVDHVTSILYRGFHLVGLNREAAALGKDLNDYWQFLMQKLTSVPGLDSAISQSVGTKSRLVPYRDLAVGLLVVEAGRAPAMFDGKLFERRGSSTIEVGHQEYMRIYQRFIEPGVPSHG